MLIVQSNNLEGLTGPIKHLLLSTGTELEVPYLEFLSPRWLLHVVYAICYFHLSVCAGLI